jgi:membrane associated rhomboid family serine protease
MALKLTPVVKIFLILFFTVFVIQQTCELYLQIPFDQYFGLVPMNFVHDLSIWQIVTYAFLHADVTHLLLNSLMFLFIGSELETIWGTRRFITYFFVGALGAGITYLLFQTLYWGKMMTPLVGASGGIYAFLVAYAILFGERTMLFMMMFPMKAKQFVMVLVGVEFLSTIFARDGGGFLSGLAHLGGMGFGFGYLWFLTYWRARQKTRELFGKKASKARGHLKLVVSQKGSPSDQEDKDPKTWH